MDRRRGRGAVATAALWLALLAAVPGPALSQGQALRLASPADLPAVARVGGEAPGLLPGRGAFELEGPFGSLRLDHGPIGDVEPAGVSDAAALAVARAFAGADAARAVVRPVALETGGTLQWGFVVDFFVPHRLFAERVYVDGRGLPIGQIPLTKAGLAFVYGRSPDHGGVQQVRLEGLSTGEHLQNPAIEVSGCAGELGAVCSVQSFAAPDSDGDWLYDPVPVDPFDPFAEVNAWHQLEDALRRLAEIGLDDLPRRVHAIVNFRLDQSGDGILEPYPNAFYFPRMSKDEDGLVFGHTGAGSLAHDADVLRHELVHAATVHLAELHARFDDYGYDPQPWVVAEAVADYFAAALSGDPAIGVHTGRLLGFGDGGIRRLDLDLSCPADLVGLPHADAEVFGGALWRAREAAGEEMDVVVATALRAMPDQPTLAQAAQAIVATATVVLPPDVAARVTDVLESTGLLECSRFRPLPPDEAQAGWLPYTRQMGRMSPGPFQYRIVVPDDAGRIRLRLEPLVPDESGEPVLYVRLGAPVRYLRHEMGERIRFEIDADAEGTWEVVLEAGEWASMTDPVLFVSPANRAEHPWGYRLTMSVEPKAIVRDVDADEPLDEAPPAEVEPDDERPEPTGCGGRAGLAVLLLVGVGALMRGRKRGPGVRRGRAVSPP